MHSEPESDGLIADQTLRAEFEALAGQSVELRRKRWYDEHTLQWQTELSFSAQGYGCAASVTDADLQRPIEEFSKRIIAPMVAIWRARMEISHA